MVLKQYVDFVKEILSKPYVKDSEKDFLSWFAIESEKYGLKKEKENLEKTMENLKKK